MKLKLIIAAAIAMALTGCENIKTVTVEKTRFEAFTVTDKLTERFEIPKIAMSRDHYRAATENERRMFLVMHIADLNSVIESCNSRLYEIEKESKKLKSIVDKRNKDGK